LKQSNILQVIDLSVSRQLARAAMRAAGLSR